MFERFKQAYKVTARQEGSTSLIVTGSLEITQGYEEFMREYAGATFNKGVYRVHTLDSRAMWTHRIEAAFPMYRGQFAAFGCDWLGRQFALDSTRRENGHPLVAMFEPGTGQALEMPGTFAGFHAEVLVEESDAALCDGFFGEWLRAGNAGPRATECVGYKVPLFLNGADNIGNLELTDMEVYWDIAAMLLAQIRDLPDGASVGKVTIE